MPDNKDIDSPVASESENAGSSAPVSDTAPAEKKDANNSDHLKIEVVKYQSLINTLSDGRSIARAAGLIALIVCLIFCGLLILAISLKRVYPYSDIKTNIQGATTIRDEEKDFTYWLFNTAELWADTGIEVSKGDVLNIRASGMSNTAIHHLVKDADDNRVLAMKWIGSDGAESRESPRDITRNQWRIVPHRQQDALVMRVAGEKSDLDPASSSTGSNIYMIGKGRESLQVNEDGVLQFALNDIVLTDDVIYKMTRDHASMLISAFSRADLPAFEAQQPEEYSPEAYRKLLANPLVARLYAEHNSDPDFPESYNFGPHPGENGEGPQNTWQKNEMTYYMDHHYRNAWFDDNIGSFLIVIERKNK